jgi:hypothetical protein
MTPGDLSLAPKARPIAEGWVIGAPDAVFGLPTAFAVPASGTVPYQRFRVSTGSTEGKWIQAAEARPGDRSVVHHLLVFVHKPGPNTDVISRTGPHLVNYAPGDMPAVHPAGTAKYIPAGAELMFHLLSLTPHMHLRGKDFTYAAVYRDGRKTSRGKR